MEINKDRLYKVGEISDLLGIPRSSITRWARNGQIPAKKIGANWFLTGEEIEYIRKYGTTKAHEAVTNENTHL